jgi:hypothetical protein
LDFVDTKLSVVVCWAAIEKSYKESRKNKSFALSIRQVASSSLWWGNPEEKLGRGVEPGEHQL